MQLRREAETNPILTPKNECKKMTVEPKRKQKATRRLLSVLDRGTAPARRFRLISIQQPGKWASIPCATLLPLPKLVRMMWFISVLFGKLVNNLLGKMAERSKAWC